MTQIKENPPKHQRFSGILVYPLFTALFPVLALYTANFDQTDADVIWRPLTVCVVLALTLWEGLRLLVRNNSKAALLSTWLLLLFFSYGHVRSFVLDLAPALGRHRFFLPVWVVLIIAGCVWILRQQRTLLTLHQSLNWFGAALILIQVVLIGLNGQSSAQARQAPNSQDYILSLPESAPDIYWIVLDGYTRADVLQKEFGYDNSPFLTQLEKSGFSIVDCALANYGSTVLSLSSSLNLSYFAGNNEEEMYFSDLIKHNPVRNGLEGIGYKTVAYKTAYGFLNLIDSDVYIKTLDPKYVKDFEFLLLQTSMGELLWDYLFNDTTGRYSWFIYQTKAARDQKIMDSLGETAKIPGPKFVYAHLTTTHPPFLLTEDGPFKEPFFYSNYAFARDHDWTRRAYVTQIQVTNQAILQAIQEILASSKTKPVIIVQGDHGISPENSYSSQPANLRMPILYAILLPGSENNVPSHFSPVNTFRLIFRTVFGVNLDLLPNHSFYQNQEYTETWDGCN